MKIQTNVASMNALRNLGVTENQQSASIAKLSSGYRINRAGDDAAGLSIANSLRSAGKALGQAQRNAQQAGSYLQIADGATQTLSTMLDRMKELATEAASDNVSDDDRKKITAEFNSLQDEWTRIINTTQYQGTKLLTGGVTLDTGSGKSTLNASNQATNITVGNAAAGTYTLTNTATAVTMTDANGVTQTVDVSAAADGSTTHLNFDKFGISFDYKGAIAADDLKDMTVDVKAGTTPAQNFRVGAGTGDMNATDSDIIQVSLSDLSAATLGIDKSASGIADLNSADSAATALGKIKTALDGLNTAIGNIGAAENRLDYATSNLNSQIQNTAAAESTIRDVDMAQEYTNYTKLSILQQAGTAMLAQANSSSQSVLQLLRG